MTHRLPSHTRGNQSGITLLEALIAIVILSLGILSILGLQMRTLSNTQTSLYRAQAIRLTEDLNERLASNPNALLNYSAYLSNWTNTPTSAKNCNTTICSHTELAAFDLQQWKQSVANTLPLGSANIFTPNDETTVNNRRQLGVMISWRENELSQTNDYKNSINAASGSGNAASCPAGQTCHLQFIPVPARCAPYFAGSTTQLFCPGTQ